LRKPTVFRSEEEAKANSEKKRESSLEKESRVTLDHFEFLDMLGEGAYGNVFMARKKNTGKFYAIKQMAKKKIT
jgi:serine/threonine protein kinase